MGDKPREWVPKTLECWMCGNWGSGVKPTKIGNRGRCTDLAACDTRLRIKQIVGYKL